MRYTLWGAVPLGAITSSHVAAILDFAKVEKFDRKSRKLNVFLLNLKMNLNGEKQAFCLKMA